MASFKCVEFYKYRRKCFPAVFIIHLTCLLLSCRRIDAEEVYQCNNETQTCVTESEQDQQNDQQFNIASTIVNPNDVQQCRSKILLTQSSGFLSDGPGNYSISMKCTWVIQSNIPNSTIRLQLIEFATECSWDHLYIYDGDSVLAPLLAVFSGMTIYNNYRLRELNQVTTSSNVVLLHFYSDLAYNMSGFNISYSVNLCHINEHGKSCSGHGVCIGGSCTCDADFHGSSCQYAICPNNCSKHGSCRMESHECNCDDGWSGLDCSQSRDKGFWTSVSGDNAAQNDNPNLKGRSQSSGSVWQGLLWVVGGHGFDLNLPFTMAFNTSGNFWSQVNTTGSEPPARYGHSSVIHEGILWMYGGFTLNGSITSELWALNLTSKEWNIIAGTKFKDCHHDVCPPVAAVGHSSVLVKDKMYIIFGYNPVYGYLNWIQEYSIDSRQWSIVATTGALVQGSYGHSSVWDPLTKKIYVYGGYQSENSSNYGSTDAFYSFDPVLKLWRVLASSGSHRYLHSAIMSGGLMLVYGGNAQNETIISSGATQKCYSSDFIAYDTVCESWYKLQHPSAVSVGGDLARYGHLAASFGPTFDDDQVRDLPYGMLIYGGFDGQLNNDVLLYVVGSCASLTKENCLTAMPGVKCVWHKANKKCVPSTNTSEGYERCSSAAPDASMSAVTIPLNYTSLCSMIASCPTCLHTSLGCVWCSHSCQYGKCKDAKPVTSPDQCDVSDANTCRLLHSCTACHTEPNCRWHQDSLCYNFVRKVGNKTEKVEVDKEGHMCEVPCSSRTTCKNCTQGSCLWCNNQNRCIDKNAYMPSFPYGLCSEWTTKDTKCRDADFVERVDASTTAIAGSPPLGNNVYIKMTSCHSYSGCAECLDDPACGWCDDGSRRGTGTCRLGGLAGPISLGSSNESPSFQCPNWFFTECPLCQCNGHSTCHEGTRTCNKPCLHLTDGDHCEKCTEGYFGNPANGGRCSPCQCNGHGSNCNPSNGSCFCTTKGVVGDRCERCDVANHYTPGLLTLMHGSANSSTQPTCYYDLQLDYQFTFNLSRKDDRFIRQINFRNVPLKPDQDLDFSVTCSGPAKVNISIRTVKAGEDIDEERFFIGNHTFTNYRNRFSRNEYQFGGPENTTFFVYVYDFRSPIWIQVSFSQHPKLELQQFFITFSVCFISLLVVAAIMWKIKQRYDMYRRRQRLFVEMEQMASRPFSPVMVELQVPPNFTRKFPVVYSNGCPNQGNRNKMVMLNMNNVETTSCSTVAQVAPQPPANAAQTVRRRRRFRPSPIALEPCADQKAAVLSLFIRLPNGTLPYTPPGQSGLAIASTLVCLGSQASRKNDAVAESRDLPRSLPKAKTPPNVTQVT